MGGGDKHILEVRRHGFDIRLQGEDETVFFDFGQEL